MRLETQTSLLMPMGNLTADQGARIDWAEGISCPNCSIA
jgi:hypothetical protein